MQYCDLRLGGIERWSIGKPKDWNMRVTDDVLECVCFLAVKVIENGQEQLRYGGTAFFVGVPSSLGGTFVYLVTAKHCVKEASKYGDLYVRVNTRDGRGLTLRIAASWTFPDDESSDVAVLTWAPDDKVVNYRRIDVPMLVTPEIRAEHGIGIGDDLFMSGLFTQHFGADRNLPIVRTGTIAAMDDEPIYDPEYGSSYRAHIIEARSIGGLSGSPVFVRFGVGRVHQKNVNLNSDLFFLLGLIRGHWNYKTMPPALGFVSDELKTVNMGMAIVTPSEDILKVLFCDELVRRREKTEAERARDNAPTKDTGFSEPEKPFTKDDFVKG